MTTIHTRIRVDADGKIVIDVGQNEAGCEVDVIIEGVRSSPPPVTQEEWTRIIRATAGSIEDPSFVRPELGYIVRRLAMPIR